MEGEENVSVKIEDPVGELRRYFYPISRVRACSSSSSSSSFTTITFFYFSFYVRRDVRFSSQRCLTTRNVQARVSPGALITVRVLIIMRGRVGLNVSPK